MRIAHVGDRAKLIVGAEGLDVAIASEGKFGPSLGAVYEKWERFRGWAEASSVTDRTGAVVSEPFSPDRAGPPSPSPRQVFAVALNYRQHAAEAGMEIPEIPIIFPKFVSSFSGPVSDVILPTETVDWETELVVVIGKQATA